MTTPSPFVSIGLPVYNGENFIKDAIQSVLAQTFSDWELVVSDNASTDRTLAICREFASRDERILVYESPRNLGVAPNYNRAFTHSRGRYFAWLAHDDYFGPEFIETCLRALEGDAEAALAFPRIVYVDGEGRPLRRPTSDLSIRGRTPATRVRELMRFENESTDIFWSQFGLIRRDVLSRTKLMDLYAASDQVLLMDIALRGTFKQIGQELFFRREHPQASTLRKNWTARDKARFQYADDPRRLVYPYCRLLKEHLVCLAKSPIPLTQKLQCTASVGRRFVRCWKDVVREVVLTPFARTS